MDLEKRRLDKIAAVGLEQVLAEEHASRGTTHVNFDVNVSTAVGLSARFPWVTPPGSVGSHDANFRLVDGGYFENSGTETASDLIRTLFVPPDSQAIGSIDTGTNISPRLLQMHALGDVDPKDVRIHLIVIGGDTEERVFYPDPDEWNGASEQLAPIRTLLNTREMRGQQAYRNAANTLALLPWAAPPGDEPAADQNPAEGSQPEERPPGGSQPTKCNYCAAPNFFEFPLYESIHGIPLGWYLSDVSRRTIARYAGHADRGKLRRPELLIRLPEWSEIVVYLGKPDLAAVRRRHLMERVGQNLEHVDTTACAIISVLRQKVELGDGSCKN